MIFGINNTHRNENQIVIKIDLNITFTANFVLWGGLKCPYEIHFNTQCPLLKDQIRHNWPEWILRSKSSE